jgi:hypothetical protein
MIITTTKNDNRKKSIRWENLSNKTKFTGKKMSQVNTVRYCSDVSLKSSQDVFTVIKQYQEVKNLELGAWLKWSAGLTREKTKVQAPELSKKRKEKEKES